MIPEPFPSGPTIGRSGRHLNGESPRRHWKNEGPGAVRSSHDQAGGTGDSGGETGARNRVV